MLLCYVYNLYELYRRTQLVRRREPNLTRYIIDYETGFRVGVLIVKRIFFFLIIERFGQNKTNNSSQLKKEFFFFSRFIKISKIYII